jgi:glycosyltransferase involved in cell wall biosynthesis
VFPDVDRHLGLPAKVECPWKIALFEHARTAIDADWMILTQGNHEQRCDFAENGVRHVVLGQPKRLHHWSYDWRGFAEAGRILSEWRPDLIHVHGSENYFGLLSARGLVHAPTLIALQGLLNPYVRTVWGPLGLARVLRIDRPLDWFRATGLIGLKRQWSLGAEVETEILRGNQWFAGRTAWDKAQLHAANPNGHYRVLHELLRPEFGSTTWALDKMERHTIFFGNLVGPHKGGDVLVDAIRIVQRFVPDVRLRVAGSMATRSGYARHLLAAIRRAGLTERFEFLGYIDAGRMARELARAHVFASASFMDNSPNAVGEAMRVGAPCVCSYVGGLPSLGRDGKEMVFFPAGDPESLAAAILAVFADDGLAQSLSLAAREKARAFHDPASTMQQLRAIYAEMLGASPGESGAVQPALSAPRAATQRGQTTMR